MALKDLLGEAYTPEIQKAIEQEKNTHAKVEAEKAVKGYKDIHLPKLDKLQKEVERLSPLEEQVSKYKANELIATKKETLIKDYGIKENVVDKYIKLNNLPEDIKSKEFKETIEKSKEDDFNKQFFNDISNGGVITDPQITPDNKPKVELSDAEKRLIG